MHQTQTYTMRRTRNQGIDAYFNPEDWSINDDNRLIYFLRLRSAHHRTLKSREVFNEVICEAQGDLSRTMKKEVTILHVKTRVQSLRGRFFDFQEYIKQPGITFDRNTLKINVDPEHQIDQPIGQSRDTYKVF